MYFFLHIPGDRDLGIVYLNNMKTELIDLQLIVCCIPEVRLDVFIIVRLTDGPAPWSQQCTRRLCSTTSSLSLLLYPL